MFFSDLWVFFLLCLCIVTFFLFEIIHCIIYVIVKFCLIILGCCPFSPLPHVPRVLLPCDPTMSIVQVFPFPLHQVGGGGGQGRLVSSTVVTSTCQMVSRRLHSRIPSPPFIVRYIFYLSFDS